jgi:hypothetical protein
MIWMLLAQSLPAFPCAALTTSAGEFAMSDAQEVILRATDAGSEVSYRVTYTGDATSFGWLIVVPGDVSDVAEGEDARFDSLRLLTDPTVEVWLESGAGREGEGGCGCTPATKEGSAIDEETDRAGGGADNVVIEAEGFAGPYTYTVLSADDDAALVDWLVINGFDLGGTETTLDLYVEEGGYSFVAVTLTPDEATTPEMGRTLPPLTIATDSAELRFPARMALTGVPEWVRTVVWVEGDSRATIADGWTERAEDFLDADDQDPSEFFSEYLQSLARDTPAYLQVFSDEIDGVWVTRFDTHAARAVHTDDVIFALTGDETQNRLVLSYTETGAAWLFLPLLGLGWGLRRRVS